jgi:hypothetical protein
VGPARDAASPAAPTAGARWVPRPGTAWQYQLSDVVDQSVDVPVYDIDLFANDASVVASLHARGKRVICYVSAGSWEPYRPDSESFPASVKGSPVEGFTDERWLDIRRQDILIPLMAARFDLCKAKGFDAVDPDLVEGYGNTTGFPLRAIEQLAYNRAIAALAHARGLSVGLKNDLGQIPALVGDFDFSVDEQCAEYQECDSLTPFIMANKAVFHVEYRLALAEFCPITVPLRLSSMKKNLTLDAARRAC